VRALHQFLPALDPGDAVSSHTLAMQRELRALGLESEVYSHTTHPSLAGATLPYESYAPRGDGRDERLLYHLAIGSVVADFLLARPERLLVDYHNLTPGEFFAGWAPDAVYGQSWGRQQLAALAARTELGLADSEFNRSELVEAGYRATAVVPILLDTASFDREVDQAALDRLQAAKAGGGSDWLFVGRVVPNKAQHDIVKAFAAYRRVFDPRARLHLVGGTSVPSYAEALGRYVAALGLGDAVSLTGPVPSGVLAAHYRVADAFVCLSEHEGFCVPLLEAMHHEVPIVAFASSAVPETLRLAGLVVEEKAPVTVAAAVHRVVGDPALRASLVAAGRARLAELSLDHGRARLRDAVESLAVR
jgi:glycosyltransferase involved in cell wall biosynthesis